MTIKSGLGHSQQSSKFIPIIVRRINNPFLGFNTHLFFLIYTHTNTHTHVLTVHFMSCFCFKHPHFYSLHYLSSTKNNGGTKWACVCVCVFARMFVAGGPCWITSHALLHFSWTVGARNSCFWGEGINVRARTHAGFKRRSAHPAAKQQAPLSAPLPDWLCLQQPFDKIMVGASSRRLLGL